MHCDGVAGKGVGVLRWSLLITCSFLSQHFAIARLCFCLLMRQAGRVSNLTCTLIIFAGRTEQNLDEEF